MAQPVNSYYMMNNRSSLQLVEWWSLFGNGPFNHPYYSTTTDHQQQKMMEKRQLFLRSYQFSRKRSLPEKMKASFVRMKKAIWFRLGTVRRKLRMKLVWSKLRYALYSRRRRSPSTRLFLPLRRLLNSPANNTYCYNKYNHSHPTYCFSCFW